MALQALRNDIGRLQTQQANGAPRYQRFGLDHNAPLSAALMPWYGRASNRLIRDAAMQALTQKLTVWRTCRRAARSAPRQLKRATTS